jgi:hypothetical protein
MEQIHPRRGDIQPDAYQTSATSTPFLSERLAELDERAYGFPCDPSEMDEI